LGHCDANRSTNPAHPRPALMAVDVPDFTENDRVRDLRNRIRAAEKEAREAEAVQAEITNRIERARIRLASLKAAELMGERPDEDPAEVRAEVERLTEKRTEAKAEAEEARAVVTALHDRAPDVFREVHDSMKVNVFNQFADTLDEAADALEAALGPLEAVEAARSSNRNWLAIAGDRMSLNPWITRDPRKAGSCARRWIEKARERARKLRQNPASMGTRYDRDNFHI